MSPVTPFCSSLMNFFRFLFASIRFSRCSSCLSGISPDGGDEENRTPDPLLARQVLSQLSYTPVLRQGLKKA